MTEEWKPFKVKSIGDANEKPNAWYMRDGKKVYIQMKRICPPPMITGLPTTTNQGE